MNPLELTAEVLKKTENFIKLKLSTSTTFPQYIYVEKDNVPEQIIITVKKG